MFNPGDKVVCIKKLVNIDPRITSWPQIGCVYTVVQEYESWWGAIGLILEEYNPNFCYDRSVFRKVHPFEEPKRKTRVIELEDA